MKILKAIWGAFDVIMYVLSAIAANTTAYFFNHYLFGITLTITFVIFALLSQAIASKKES